jgi:hypothetical protein
MLLWQLFFDAYGADYLNVAITDGGSGHGRYAPIHSAVRDADPATASTPLVATMVTSAESSSI